MRRVTVVVAGLAVAVAACSSGSDAKSAVETASPTAITVKLVDGGCDQPTYAAKAGKIAFTAVNTTDRDAEFEILAPGPSIVAEKDPLGAGKTATLTESLKAGDYEVRCALGTDAETSTLTVSGKGGGAALEVDQAALDGAVAQYRTFVLDQADQLKQKTQAFADAVIAGDVEQAKALYAPGRIPWETIEPVAELFPDVDAAIDSRVDDHNGPNDPEWTGWHRIEKGLWADNSAAGLTPFAQQLVTDTNGLVDKVQSLAIQPGVMTNGAAALIEEASQGKITGEEERYSHTDLITFAANVDGAKKIVELLRPVLSTAPRGPALLAKIDEGFAKVDAILVPYQQGDGYVSYEQVTETSRDQLKAAMAGLSEELAEISGTMGLEVQ